MCTAQTTYIILKNGLLLMTTFMSWPNVPENSYVPVKLQSEGRNGIVFELLR